MYWLVSLAVHACFHLQNVDNDMTPGWGDDLGASCMGEAIYLCDQHKAGFQQMTVWQNDSCGLT